MARRSPAAHGGGDQGFHHHTLLGPAFLHGTGQAQVNEGNDVLHRDVTELQGECFMGEKTASLPLGEVMLLFYCVKEGLEGCISADGTNKGDKEEKQEKN